MFRSAYDGKQKAADVDALDFDGDPGYTKQEFKEECDINVIMSKYTKFGVMPPIQEGQWGDFTNVPDLLEAQQIVQRAAEDFSELSSAVRERFSNDPVKLMSFLSDDKNRDEAIKLGLIAPPKVEAPVVPVPAPAP